MDSGGEKKESDLQARIRGWLDRQGYPFELQMGRQIAAAGWSVAHGRYFKDPRTAKARELDLHATRRTPAQELPFVWMSLAVQCKHGAGRPWVGFVSPTPESDRRFPSTAALGKAASSALFSVAFGLDGTTPKLIQPGKARAHGITDVTFAKRTHGRRNAAFAAVRSAEAAAASFAAEHDQYGAVGGVHSFTMEIPVVILDGDLFEFRLTADGSESLIPTNWLKVTVPSSSSGSSHTLVNVIRPEALSSLLEQARGDLEAVDKVVRPNWDRIKESIALGLQPEDAALAT